MKISGNINRGAVLATATGDSQNVGAGGIAGRLEAAYITSCSNFGAISCSLAGWTGALAGYNSTMVTGICSGIVNGVPVNADNCVELADGPSSTGTADVTFATETTEQ